jgi:hypothetical protein
MEIVFVLLAIALIFFLTRSEKLENENESDYVEVVSAETADRNQAMIFATRDYIQTYHNLCTYCIET